MKNILLAFAGFGMLTACNQTEPVANKNTETMELAMNTENTMVKMSFYDFKTKTLMGEEFDFSTLKGKRVLIVNTASECGFTPQYEQLQELFKEFGGEKFIIIGFPSNDFGKQEPGSNEDIATFCEKNYGVTFPMMDKTPVKGADQHPVYAWLTDEDQNGVDNAKVSWNFNKFLVDENGKWVAHYGSRTSPLDEEIVNFAEGK